MKREVFKIVKESTFTLTIQNVDTNEIREIYKETVVDEVTPQVRENLLRINKAA
jgi:hypothetical protein